MILLNDLKRAADTDRDVIEPALLRVAASGWFVLGNEVAGFERQFAEYVGVDHCIGVGNGTDALELSFRALGLGPGDGVVTVANAGMYTTLAARLAGCEPVFCDVDPETMLMDPEALAAIRGKDIRAVVVTHLFGRVAQMPALLGIVRERGWAVIEDCAQAHGARRDGRMAGSFGDVATFSFYPTKNLGALGDGGAVATPDEALADRVRSLRAYNQADRYRHEARGVNSRLDELQAAILRVRLPGLDAATERRRAIAAAYDEALAGTAVRPLTRLPDRRHVFHLYVVRAPDRDAFRAGLDQAGVATLVHYPLPLHHQPAYRSLAADVPLLASEHLAGEIVSLPLYPELTDEEVAHVAAAASAAAEGPSLNRSRRARRQA